MGISEYQIGILPTTRDHVIIGDVNRTRNSNIKVLYVIGLNDGVFPMPYNDEGFINDMERNLLLENGIEIAKDTKKLLVEENFNIYKAFETKKTVIQGFEDKEYAMNSIHKALNRYEEVMGGNSARTN